MTDTTIRADLCSGFMIRTGDTEQHFAVLPDGTIRTCTVGAPTVHFFRHPRGQVPRITVAKALPAGAEAIGTYPVRLTVPGGGRRGDYYPDTMSRAARNVLQTAGDYRSLGLMFRTDEGRDLIELARQAAMMRAAIVIGAGL